MPVERPCCPANFFVGPVDGLPTAPADDAPACVQRLSLHGLRCLQRFHMKHQHDALLREEALALLVQGFGTELFHQVLLFCYLMFFVACMSRGEFLDTRYFVLDPSWLLWYCSKR